MSTNTPIMITAVTRRNNTDNSWTVQSPLANLTAQGKDKLSALTKFVEMVGVYMFVQQRQSQGTRGPGRPSKNYNTHIHVQVQKDDKDKFDAIADEFNLSQSETVILLLNSFEILREDFANKDDMQQAEARVLQLAGAGK